METIRWLGAEQNGGVWARLIRCMRRVSHRICKTYYCAADGRSETGAMPGDGKPSWRVERGEERSNIHVRHKRPATPLLAAQAGTSHLPSCAASDAVEMVDRSSRRAPLPMPSCWVRSCCLSLVVGCQRVAVFQISDVSILRACSLWLLDRLPACMTPTMRTRT
jgi:hypothetical protein